LYAARQVQVGLDVVRDLRTSTEGVVSLESFLGERDHTIFEVMISLYVGSLFYVGLLPIGCFAWGLLRARSLTFAAFVGSTVLLGWFGLGGLLALALYRLVPFVALTRYLYLGFYLMRAPILFAGAAAWDEFSPTRENVKACVWAFLLILFSIDLSLYGEHLVPAGTTAAMLMRLWRPVGRKLAVYAALATLAAAAMYAFRRISIDDARWSWIPRSTGLVAAALLAALFLDVFQYSYRACFKSVRLDVQRPHGSALVARGHGLDSVPIGSGARVDLAGRARGRTVRGASGERVGLASLFPYLRVCSIRSMPIEDLGIHGQHFDATAPQASRRRAGKPGRTARVRTA
jgi:hypothetical protein